MGCLRRKLSSAMKTTHCKRLSTLPSGLENTVYDSACWRKPTPCELSVLQIRHYPKSVWYLKRVLCLSHLPLQTQCGASCSPMRVSNIVLAPCAHSQGST